MNNLVVYQDFLSLFRRRRKSRHSWHQKYISNLVRDTHDVPPPLCSLHMSSGPWLERLGVLYLSWIPVSSSDVKIVQGSIQIIVTPDDSVWNSVSRLLLDLLLRRKVYSKSGLRTVWRPYRLKDQTFKNKGSVLSTIYYK